MNAGNHSRIKNLLRIFWNSRRELPYAWQLLRRGVCDGCSLGAYGLRDPLGGTHLCTTTLESLHCHIMGALDVSLLQDVAPLKDLPSDRLRSLGRLPYPMIRRTGERGFARVGWADAFRITCDSIRNIAPHEIGFLAAAGEVTNEAYYVFQKLARVLGTNNVALCATRGDASCISALRATVGAGAATCSLADMIDTDLLVVFGSETALVHGSLAKYLRSAKKHGTRIVGVNRTSGPSSGVALQDQCIDDIFRVRAGGEISFLNGVLKALIDWNKVDREFIGRHTTGFDRLAAGLLEQPWEALEQRSGLLRSEMQRFAAHYRGVSSAVFVYCTEPPQREVAGNVKALVNLALARGMFGREKCGILPILSQHGVQGAGDCGVAPDQFPGAIAIGDQSARRFSNLWYHPVPSNPGLNIPGMIDAAHRAKLKLLYCIGPHSFQRTPHAAALAGALARIPLRIHQDIALNKLQLVDGPGAVLILPAQTRYEQPGGGTMTSTERRIVFAPRVSRRAIGESLPDWEIPAIIGRKSMPNGEFLFPFGQSRSIRAEMARVMPIYQGIERLNGAGDHLQWGGPQLCTAGRFRGMPGERALFSLLEPPKAETGDTR